MDLRNRVMRHHWRQFSCARRVCTLVTFVEIGVRWPKPPSEQGRSETEIVLSSAQPEHIMISLGMLGVH